VLRSTSGRADHAPPSARRRRWRFRHLFVDEFQDASAAQFRLLRAWLGDRADLCVVGDGDQAFGLSDACFVEQPPVRRIDAGKASEPPGARSVGGWNTHRP